MASTEGDIPTARAELVDRELTGDPAAFDRTASDVITIAEERASVTVERREAGGVRVRVTTEPVEKQLSVDLGSETVEVTRHPKGHEIDAIPEPREEGDLLIVPVVEERAVVVTKLFLTEEIHVRRNRTTETVAVPVTLRRQHAVVEQLDPGQPDAGPRGRAGDLDHGR